MRVQVVPRNLCARNEVRSPKTEVKLRFQLVPRNSFARNEVRSSKTEVKVRVQVVPRNPFARNEVRSSRTEVKVRVQVVRFRTNLGSHLITKNVHIPLSSTKRYVHGHTLFSRPFALPSAISRFSRFSTAIQRFSTAKCTLFHGQILFSRPYLDSKAKPFFRSHLAKRPLASFFAIKRPPRK